VHVAPPTDAVTVAPAAPVPITVPLDTVPPPPGPAVGAFNTAITTLVSACSPPTLCTARTVTEGPDSRATSHDQAPEESASTLQSGCPPASANRSIPAPGSPVPLNGTEPPTSSDDEGCSITGEAAAFDTGVGGGSVSVAAAVTPEDTKAEAARSRPSTAPRVAARAARRRGAAAIGVPGKWFTYLPFRGLLVAKSKFGAFA
jgi:hypothetical protein